MLSGRGEVRDRFAPRDRVSLSDPKLYATNINLLSLLSSTVIDGLFFVRFDIGAKSTWQSLYQMVHPCWAKT